MIVNTFPAAKSSVSPEAPVPSSLSMFQSDCATVVLVPAFLLNTYLPEALTPNPIPFVESPYHQAIYVVPVGKVGTLIPIPTSASAPG
jgi:hypothetical protein